MGSKGGGNVKVPSPSKEYEKGLTTYLRFLPQELQQELGYRQQYDPQFIQQQLGLQGQFDPQLAQQQADALARRDPKWLQTHDRLGDLVTSALTRGNIDPRQAAAYNQLSQMAGKADPTRTAEYQALGQQVTGDTLRGTTMDPATLRQTTQAILSRSPNLSYGEAQNMAAAVYTGQRGQALQQQRQQAGQQFLQQTSPTQQQQQSLGQFYSQASPLQNTMALAGTYLQPSNSIVGMMNQIPGVQAPRSFGYVNPNAGYQGQQFGLQNFQNQVAGQQINNQNPWMNAFQNAGYGASIGNQVSGGGGYGALIGAGLGIASNFV